MYFWCISWLLYTANIPAPPTTPFVLIDFASRVVANGFGFGSLARLLTGTTRGNVQDVREKLADKRVFLGEVVQEVESSDGTQDMMNGVHGAQRRIGFALNSAEVVKLRHGQHY